MTTMQLPPTVTIGGDLTVPRIGYGAMRLTGQPGNFGPYRDQDAGVRLLRRAYDLGVRFIDTARAYGPGHNEELIARAFDPWPADLVVATKVGIEKPAPDRIRPDGRPEAIRRGVEESLRRLRCARLDLVYLHRPDPEVPIEDSIGALADARAAGLVRHVGVSNVTAEEFRLAAAVVPLAALQNQMSVTRDDPLLDTVPPEVVYVPYGSLGAHPLRQGAPLADDPALVTVAGRHDATATQVALAWLLWRSPRTLLIPGTTSEVHVAANLDAARLTLTDADLAELARS